MLRRTMRCSFCNRPDSEVAKLVAGPLRIFAGRVYICDRCAAQTIRIMEAHSGDDQPRTETESLFHRISNRLGWSRHHDRHSRSECHAT
jgi:ClpX C4-type zinc finger protein